MRLAALAFVLGALPSGGLLAQDPAGEPEAAPEKQVDPPPTQPAPPALPSPPVLDAATPFDHTAYEAALGGIVAAYPDLVRARSLGKSRGGRDLWLAVVADGSGGDPGRRPAAVLVTDLEPSPATAGRPPGPEAALFALSSLLEQARAGGATRDRLRRCTLYVLPAPDPDGSFGAAPSPGPSVGPPAAPSPEGQHAAIEPRRFRLDRNFPAGWEPYDADGGGAAGATACPYPLSEPESRTLARFLLERTNLSTLIVLDGQPASGIQREGRTVAAGSLEAFCAEVLDGAVQVLEPFRGESRSSPTGSAPEGFYQAADEVAAALDDLPRLECAAPKVERLRPEVWLVDVPLSNAGRLPTLGRTGRATTASSVQLRTNGGRVVACAVQRPVQSGAGGTYDAVRGARGTWPLGHLEGRASVGVRLVVEAAEGTKLEAVFESPRSGTARATVELR